MTSKPASKKPKVGKKGKPTTAIKPAAQIPDATRCFVYITLPGQTQAVTAGRYDLVRTRAGVPLGQFVYGKRYLERADAVEIDPVELRLAARRYETTQLKGVFGALRDAGPDAWGRRIIDRHYNRELSELGYLMNSADDRAGALGFGTGQAPPAPRKTFNQTLQLEELQTIADEVLKDNKPTRDQAALAEQVNKLLLINTLMGGARPKAVVEDGDALWVAKFNRPDQDRWNNAKIEHTMLLLAKKCGISVADSKVVPVGLRDVLMVKRFDREQAESGGYFRHRMVSALTILRGDEMDPRDWSYVTLAERLRLASSTPRDDAVELFRRMCFNALVSNLDDHPRNHALVAKDRWKLSPAYDITPQSPVAIERRNLAMICGTAGTYANIHNLLSQCGRFLLQPEEAKTIILRMQEMVSKSWRNIARKQGVTTADCEAIGGAFVYPGFSYELEAT
jgi:serine/threonine-protein kinase HipA